MSERKIPEYTVTSENGSVWVNGKHNCLARFTPRAYEIYHNHNEPTEVIGTTKTLAVTNKPTDEKIWRNFVTELKTHHGIDLSDMAYPGQEAK